MNNTDTRRKLKAIFNGAHVVIPDDRIYALSLCGYTQVDVGKLCGVCKARVFQVIHDTNSGYSVASKIAELTGLTLNKLWPDGRYDRPPRRLRKAA